MMRVAPNSGHHHRKDGRTVRNTFLPQADALVQLGDLPPHGAGTHIVPWISLQLSGEPRLVRRSRGLQDLQ